MQPTRRHAPAAARRHIQAAAVVALAIWSLLAAGCRPPTERAADPARTVEVALVTTPARVGPAAVEVRLVVGAAPADGAAVRVVGDMTHAGMAPVVAMAEALGGGLYRTTEFAFDMAGDWVITAEVTYADGVTRQGTLSATVSR